MIAIDTNVLIGFLVGDSPSQTKKALALISNESVFVSKTVLLESEWVLRYAYDFNKKQINFAFSQLTKMKNVSLEDPRSIKKALDWYENQKLDFAVALHLASGSSAKKFVSFDKALVKNGQHIKDINIDLL